MTRSLLDIGIFLSRQVVVTLLVLGFLLAIVNRIKPSLLHFSKFPNARPRVWALVSVLIFSGIGLWYLNIQGFAGEVEPLVSSLSWLWQEGQPLYHNLDAPYQYSVLYGPSVFLTNGLFLKILGPTIFSAKVASLLAAIGSLLFVYAALLTKKRNSVAAWAVVAAVLLYWSHGFGIYLVRPDALLVFATGMGIYLAAKSRPVIGAVGLAALLGFAINLKIHGALYFIPILYLAGSRWGWKWIVWVILGSLPLIMAPFLLFPAVSFENYLLWLREAARHGLVTTDLPLTFRYAFLVTLPWLAFWSVLRHPASFWPQARGSFLTFMAALILVMVVAAKPGAGPVHIMPLVPITVVLVGRCWRNALDFSEDLVPTLNRLPSPLLAAGLTLLLVGSITGYRSTRLVAWELQNAGSLATEVKGIMTKYAGLSMAMACGGENASFRETWIRPLLVFDAQPILIDPISVMDRCLAGQPLSPGTYAALKSGQVKMWLVPRGQVPFAKTNWYPPHDEIFPKAFRTAFIDSYDREDHTEHFDLWFWKGAGHETSQPIVVRAGGENSGVMAPAE